MYTAKIAKGGKRAVIGFILAVAVLFSAFAASTASVQAASRTVKQSIKPIGNGKGCKLWVQDTITYKVDGGKIVSKPTVTCKTSTANKVLGITTSLKYYQVKSPTITYKKNSKTATVKTYWGCKQTVGIWKFKVTYGKTCTVTYTLNGNGKITYTKKSTKLKLID